MRFAILGPVRAWRDDVEVGLGPAQQRVLLALLLAHAVRPVSLDEMVDVLWGQDPPAAPVNAVYRHIGVLRRLLEPDLPLRAPGRWLLRDGGGYRLDASTDAVDLLRFRDKLRRAGEVSRGGAPERAVPLFLEALALRKGPTATGIPAETRAHPVFTAIDREYLTAVKEAADAALECGAVLEADTAGGLLMVLHRTAAEHPLDEAVQARLVLSLSAAGQRAEALDTWQRVRTRLADELGIGPGPELRAAQQRVLRADSETAALGGGDAPGPRGPLTDPGEAVAESTGKPGPGGVAGPPVSSTVCGAGRPSGVPGAHAVAGSPGELWAYAYGTPGGSPAGAGPLAPPGSAPALADPVVRPAQLPADLPTFAGRRADLARALALAPGDGPPAKAVAIAAICGMAGIGKSTLAVRWARRIAHRFPDGQLYVNLRGFDPGGSALDPGSAIRGFLEALGVPPMRIPAGVDAQAGLYRSLLSGRRVLILLDNARDAEQVRPLLPGAAGCLVLITSRDRLTGLVAAQGARSLTLDPFTAPEAREAFARRLGAERVTAEADAVDEIVARCAGLPLALAVVATRAAAHPDFPLSVISRELRDAHGSLDAFADPDPAGDVRAVFSWSYQALSPDAARLLRLLALHPGPDIAAPAAAAVAGTTLSRTRYLLAELTRAHLLTEHEPSRYTCHDLLRTYATELAHSHDREPEREAAVHRLLDHYLHTAHAADRLLSPWWVATTLPEASPGAAPETFADDGHALRWFAAERPVLREVIELAARTGFDTHVWQLAWTLERFLDRQGHWHDSAAVQSTGLAAATRVGHGTARAHLHRGLARACARLERYDDAGTHIRLSLDLFTALADRLGLAHAHRCHSWLLDRLGRHDEALDEAQQALVLYRAVGDRAAETSALHALGWTHVLRGDHRHAAPYFERALAGLEGLGDRYGEAGTWDSLGIAHHHLGEFQRGAACFQRALGLYREVGDRYNEGRTLRHLGDTYQATGDLGAARTVWESALAVLAGTDTSAADEIRGKLDSLGSTRSALRVAAAPG